MNDIRRGEIAILFVKEMFREKGLHFSKNLPVEIQTESNKLGISPKEAMDFAESIIRELVDEMFGNPKKRS